MAPRASYNVAHIESGGLAISSPRSTFQAGIWYCSSSSTRALVFRIDSRGSLALELLVGRLKWLEASPMVLQNSTSAVQRLASVTSVKYRSSPVTALLSAYFTCAELLTPGFAAFRGNS